MNKLGIKVYNSEFTEFRYSEEFDMNLPKPIKLKDFEGMVKSIQFYIDYIEGNIDMYEYMDITEKYTKTKKAAKIDRLQEVKAKKIKLNKQKKKRKKKKISIKNILILKILI